MSEAQLQHHCYRWFCSQFPHDRKYLWMQYNNPRNPVEGAKLVGMGLQKGIADMCYLAKGNFPYFLELKIEKGKQTPEQAAWQRAVEERGAIYAIVRSIEEFQFWINTAVLHPIHFRVSPALLIANCEQFGMDYTKIQELQRVLWCTSPKQPIPTDLKKYIANLNLQTA